MTLWALARTRSGTLVVTPLRALGSGSIPLELISRHESMGEAWAALQARRQREYRAAPIAARGSGAD